MSRQRVVIAEELWPASHEEPIRVPADLDLVPARLANEADIAGASDGADAIIVALQPMTASAISGLSSSVKLVARAGIGLDSIDLDAANRRDVGVIHIPDYATSEVAEHAVTLMLAAYRQLVLADQIARQDWSTWQSIGPYGPLTTATVGVVGAGLIGKEVIARLQPLVKRILVFDPGLEMAPDGTERIDSLGELWPRCDVVTLHLPLTTETANLISADVLSSLPDHAVLVNVSRGGLVDEHALVAALKSGSIRAAALDVMSSEPLSVTSPLRECPRLLLTPHLAWYSTSSQHRSRQLIVDGAHEYLAGQDVRSARVVINARTTQASSNG